MQLRYLLQQVIRFTVTKLMINFIHQAVDKYDDAEKPSVGHLTRISPHTL